jgi:hypothetical protein
LMEFSIDCFQCYNYASSVVVYIYFVSSYLYRIVNLWTETRVNEVLHITNI